MDQLDRLTHDFFQEWFQKELKTTLSVENHCANAFHTGIQFEKEVLKALIQATFEGLKVSLDECPWWEFSKKRALKISLLTLATMNKAVDDV